LMQKLKSEDEGILAWLVAGAVAYAAEGLEPPAEVVGTTKAYFRDEDALGRWLEDCEQCEPKDGDTVAALFEDFKKWGAEEGLSGLQPGTMTAFSKALTNRRYEKHKGSDAKRFGLRAQLHAGSEFEPIFSGHLAPT
jgi:putative DNA primase/helicase